MIFNLSVFDFAGRMHPVLVHLPIGVLLLVSIYFIFVSAERREAQRHFIGVALFWGMLSAVAACVSGWLLANSGDYDLSAVANHQWMGIATAAVAIISYVLYKRRWIHTKWLMAALVLSISVAGHLGGSITHGADYLTEPFSGKDAAANGGVPPLPNVQEALVYNDIVRPILSSKCYSCHGEKKQKGKLRLDEPGFILKGGKDGAAIVWDHADESIMIQRILLPESDEDHMPPKEKPQLSKAEMDILQWWVGSGAAFNKKVNQSKISEKIKPVLAALQSGGQEAATVPLIPEAEVSAADEKVVAALKEKGVVVIPVAANTNYLSVNFVGADTVTADQLKGLESLKDQVIWLKIGAQNLKDADMERIGKLKSLLRLYIDGNPITDRGLQYLKGLSNLQYINLSGTAITGKGLLALQALKSLKQVYVYNVRNAQFDVSALKKAMPQTVIDTGGYKVPTLESDTTVFKKEPQTN
ncbi:c-type cytochrome domain-containing protein [Niabella insulamsoli]|uniref:c-type cytochrome domain-containing protein n=1 Tax=Niabella insulamsoli TaxID=3144874 RepID=UPI0031FCF0AC